MYRRTFFISLCCLCLACKHDQETGAIPEGNLEIVLSYRYGTNPLITDTMALPHPAGYLMEVKRLQYYISGIQLYNQHGLAWQSDEVFYTDIRVPAFSRLLLKHIPSGEYSGIRFLVGLDSSTNKSYSLPPGPENNNMEWPDVMGGGYHFLKLEGNYLDSGITYGYAMHLGAMQPTEIILDKPFSVSQASNQLPLTMNVCEWFQNPYLFDFDTDGNYSMGDTAAMRKLRDNGADIFNP